MSGPSEQQRMARTPLVRPGDDASGLEGVAAPTSRWWLRVVTTSDERALDGLHELRGELVLGREAEGTDADAVELDDPGISRVHAVLRRSSSAQPAIEDLRSTNGTWVNGRRVTRGTLRDGDVLRLGQTVLLIARDGADERGLADPYLPGRTPAMEELRRMLERAAPSTLPALVVGPTGTGKELVAQTLHQWSGRPGPLVPINCASLPRNLVEDALFGHVRGAFTDARKDEPGAFVQADGGTLFLDEIGEMATEVQPKLLRALESGEITPLGASRPTTVDVRVVAATNQPLDDRVQQGSFREDLYARLAGLVIRTPALPDRRDDVLPLFRRFLPEALRDRPVTADFAEALLLHDWPRGVRELRRLAERLAVLHADEPSWHLDLLDEDLRRPVLERDRVPEDETGAEAQPETTSWPPTRAQLEELLDRCDGNVSQVASLVGRNRKQVYRWMDALGVQRGTGR